MMAKLSDKKKSADDKRAGVPRDVKKSDDFLKDWERLSHSGKHDMHRLKEVMTLLFQNDAPLPPEWKDHLLKGNYEGLRECHVKGDLLLVYQVHNKGKHEAIMFYRAGTHSEIFG